jgi:hypothetical protein
MEDSVFPSPAVAELMQRELVEARVHTDTQNTLTAEQFVRNRRLQEQLAGTKANPWFVIVDPVSGNKLAEGGLSGGYTQWPANWVAFVEGAVASRPKKAAGASR